MMRTIALVLVAAGLACGTARGQTLTVEAAPATSPALRYELLRVPARGHEGNAAVEYMRAAFSLSMTDEEETALMDRLAAPLENLRTPEAREAIDRAITAPLENLRRAERARHCDWQVIVSDGIAVTIPELGQVRLLARVLGVKARERIAAGDFDGAVDMIALLVRMGTDVGEGTTLIQALVGMAVVQVAIERMQELIQQPGAPNLYWALVDLGPAPVDMRRAMRFERHFVDLEMPELGRIIDGRVKPHEAEGVVRELERRLRTLVSDPQSGAAESGWNLAASTIASYPKAKAQLKAQGLTDAEIDAYPVSYVSMRYTLVRYMEMRDDLFKWYGLPTHEAMAGMAASEAGFSQAMARREGFPFSLLLPALGRALETGAMQQRHLAGLRVVEAIRMHAHATGSLPARLDSVRVVPVPINPMTGEAFDYRVEGNEAVITGPGLTGSRRPPLELRIRLVNKPR